MVSKIGIKLADGSFFPIMDEGAFNSEVLELTTVRDNQGSVQINLFKKADEVTDPDYIGTLIVENIADKPSGEPTIELTLKLDGEKQLSAEAVDLDSGVRQALTVSLEALDVNALDTIDFDLPNFDGLDDDSFADIDDLDGSEYEEASYEDSSLSDDSEVPHISYEETLEGEDTEKEKRRFPLWLIILAIILGAAILVLGIMLLTKGFSSTNGTSTSSSVTSVDESATKKKRELITVPPTPMKKEETKKEEPVVTPPKEEKKAEPVSKEKEGPAVVAPVSRGDGSAVKYRLKWGDTLWDLSETYYKTPWLYKKIAKHNNIKNPDLIISGTQIEIPPK